MYTVKYDHIYLPLAPLQLSECPLQVSSHYHAFFLFMCNDSLNPVSTVHMCMCVGPSIRNLPEVASSKKSDSLSPSNYPLQQFFNKEQRSGDHLPHL